MTKYDKSSSCMTELTKIQRKSWATVGPRHSRASTPTGAVERWQLSGEVVVEHFLLGITLLGVIWTFEYPGTQPVSTITYSQATIPRFMVLKEECKVFENWDSYLDTSKAYYFRKDALWDESHSSSPCPYSWADILEIEFSSIKTSPDVAQGFMKH